MGNTSGGGSELPTIQKKIQNNPIREVSTFVENRCALRFYLREFDGILPELREIIYYVRKFPILQKFCSISIQILIFQEISNTN